MAAALSFDTKFILKCGVLSSIVVPVVRWLVCHGVPVWAPPDTLFDFFGQTQGVPP
jgi:hypothetical protein